MRAMTEFDETYFTMAKWHVSDGEARFAQQATLVALLREQGHNTAPAESLLAEFEATLADMREHLRALQMERDARGGQARDAADRCG